MEPEPTAVMGLPLSIQIRLDLREMGSMSGIGTVQHARRTRLSVASAPESSQTRAVLTILPWAKSRLPAATSRSPGLAYLVLLRPRRQICVGSVVVDTSAIARATSLARAHLATRIALPARVAHLAIVKITRLAIRRSRSMSAM
jgi:hypothetical protein